MRFSRYKTIFMIFSLLSIIGLFTYTFMVEGGFRRSITFNGGIRFSINFPAHFDKDKVEATLVKGGFERGDFQVRLTSVATNKFDLEFGPSAEKRVADQVKAEQEKRGKGEKKPSNPADKNDQAKDEKGKKASQNKDGKTVPVSANRSAYLQELEKEVFANLEEVGLGAGNVLVDVIENVLLTKVFPGVDEKAIVSREAISASYGDQLSSVAIWAFVSVVMFIGAYLWFRFDVPFAIGASLALVHDVVLSVGFIGVMRIEPTIPVVAAVLTIIGYSINDTIVIFDRIREGMEEHSYAALDLTMDLAITNTLSRTIVTSVLTLLAVLALLFGGAETLKDFALTLTFGLVVGTYSSIFVASHFVQFYEHFREKFSRA